MRALAVVDERPADRHQPVARLVPVPRPGDDLDAPAAPRRAHALPRPPVRVRRRQRLRHPRGGPVRPPAPGAVDARQRAAPRGQPVRSAPAVSRPRPAPGQGRPPPQAARGGRGGPAPPPAGRRVVRRGDATRVCPSSAGRATGTRRATGWSRSAGSTSATWRAPTATSPSTRPTRRWRRARSSRTTPAGGASNARSRRPGPTSARGPPGVGVVGPCCARRRACSGCIRWWPCCTTRCLRRGDRAACAGQVSRAFASPMPWPRYASEYGPREYFERPGPARSWRNSPVPCAICYVGPSPRRRRAHEIGTRRA